MMKLPFSVPAISVGSFNPLFLGLVYFIRYLLHSARLPGGSLLTFLSGVYIFINLPMIFGGLFSFFFPRYFKFFKYPFKVGALAFFPIIHNNGFYVRVVFYDVVLKNKKGFPLPVFAQCGRIEFEFSVSLTDAMFLLLGKTVPAPLHGSPDFWRSAHLDFEFVEIVDLKVSLATHKDICNFQDLQNEIEIQQCLPMLRNKKKLPNQVSVEILRGKNLKPHRLKKIMDPYVVVTIRKDEASTATQTETTKPMFNENLHFNLTDPSAVIHIVVYDRDSPDATHRGFVGQWAGQVKYLIQDPSHFWHHEKDFTQYVGGRENKYGFSGWIPLATKNWEYNKELGTLQVRITWSYQPDQVLEETGDKNYLTTMDHLKQQSKDISQTVGPRSIWKEYLEDIPVSLSCKRFTFRSSCVYIQDCFDKDYPDLMKQFKPSSNSRQLKSEMIRVGFMEVTKPLQPHEKEDGITLYKAVNNTLFSISRVMERKGVLGLQLSEILLGGDLSSSANALKAVQGDLGNKIKMAGREIKTLLNQAGDEVTMLNQKHNKNRQDLKQLRFTVNADDEDFLLDEVEIEGYLERAASNIDVGPITEETLEKLLKKTAKFQTYYFQLKGESMFYTNEKPDEIDPGLYNIHYKLNLRDVQFIIFQRKTQEFFLFATSLGYYVRLRRPKNQPVGENCPSLQRWFSSFANHVQLEEV